MYDMIKTMHEHFKIEYNGEPRELSEEECEFRLKAFCEEIQEYMDAVARNDLEGQFDALIDLIVFAMGACEQHGFDLPAGFERVMRANLQKEVVASAEESKRGHKHDLKKPEGWRAPYLKDLVQPQSFYRGVILLEGPDACGKTTLAQHFVDNYGAHYIHSTWSPILETRMEQYLDYAMDIAYLVSQNQLVVLDRHWLSELVYTDVFREDAKRAEWHTRVHTTFIQLLNGIVIFCMPNSIASAYENFSECKDTREEMYDDIAEVIYAYHALWDGDESWREFKHDNSYVRQIIEHGGLKESPSFIRYDYTTDGQDMDKFFKSLPMMQVAQ